MSYVRFIYFCIYSFFYRISSDWGQSDVDAKLHAGVIGLSVVQAAILMGLFFINPYGIGNHRNVKLLWISASVIIMAINILFMKKFIISNEYKNYMTDMNNGNVSYFIIGGFISLFVFTLMFVALAFYRKSHHIS